MAAILCWCHGGGGGVSKEKPVFSLNLMDLSRQDLDTDPENLDSIFLTVYLRLAMDVQWERRCISID